MTMVALPISPADKWATAAELLTALATCMYDECPWCDVPWTPINDKPLDLELIHEPDCELGALLVLAEALGHRLAAPFTPSRTGDTS